MNGMSMNLTWTRTIRSYVLATMIVTARPSWSPARAGTAMAVGSMTCIQLGLALSVPLFGQVGPLGVVWLRLAWASVILLVAVRPRPWRFRRPALLAVLALGVVTAGVTMLFMAAVARLPLGTATALEFLGPLSVAVARGRGGRRLLWPGLAAAGVLLLTHPWQGGASLAGVAFALGAAVCWACYIVLTQAVGDEVAGLQGLAVSIPVAALVATLVAGPGIRPGADAASAAGRSRPGAAAAGRAVQPGDVRAAAADCRGVRHADVPGARARPDRRVRPAGPGAQGLVPGRGRLRRGRGHRRGADRFAAGPGRT